MRRFQEKITEEDIEELPLMAFEGNIVIVDNQVDIEKIVPYLKTKKVLGFDTETRPAFQKGQRNQVSILQLSTENDAFIFRLNKIGLPASLKSILSSDKIVKAGVAIHDDIKALQKKSKFEPGGFIELQSYVKGFGIQDASLKKLTANILGFKISKRQRLSNWDDEILTEAQQIYAATDAWVGLRIYNILFNIAEENSK